MSQLAKRCSLFFTVLVGFSLLFNSLSASAQGVPSFSPSLTDKLILTGPDGVSSDVTKSYLSLIFNGKFWNNKDLLNVHSSSFEKARSSGVWGVVLREYPGSSGGVSRSSVELYWLESPCSVVFAYASSSSYWFLCNGSSHKWSRVSLFSDYVTYSSGFEDSFRLFSSSKLFSFNGDYAIDPSINIPIPPFPKGSVTPFDHDVSDWNNNCGLDVGCHLGNIGNAVKSFFFFLLGVFDFSENNSLLKLLKWLFIPQNVVDLFDFTSVSNSLDNSLKPVSSAIDLLNQSYKALQPVVIFDDRGNYCHNGHSYYSPGGANSQGSIFLMDVTVFGSPFRPDLCSFERAIGGSLPMSKIRVFTGTLLFISSFFLWYLFWDKIFGSRF